MGRSWVARPSQKHGLNTSIDRAQAQIWNSRSVEQRVMALVGGDLFVIVVLRGRRINGRGTIVAIITSSRERRDLPLRVIKQ